LHYAVLYCKAVLAVGPFFISVFPYFFFSFKEYNMKFIDKTSSAISDKKKGDEVSFGMRRQSMQSWLGQFWPRRISTGIDAL
jgi:hypothetical protein